jgi:hypothetical protein
MSVTIISTSAQLVRYGKGLKLGSDGGNSGSRKDKWSYGDAYGRVWLNLFLKKSWSLAIGFVLIYLSGICFSSREDGSNFV